MHYLFLGNDSITKDEKIGELKKKILSSLEAQKFDYQVLHGNKLNSDDLKQALLFLPAVAKQRLVVIRAIHKLSLHNKKLILEFLQAGEGHVVLIFDSDESDLKNSFIAKLKTYTKTHSFSGASKENLFDMTRAITARNPVAALKILANLLAEGNHPLQVMGGLVWFWGKSRTRLSAERFKKGLMCLQEADLNIKRSRLKPEHTLEVLVVKLISLLAY